MLALARLPSDVHIRRAVAMDIASLARIRTRSWAASYRGLLPARVLDRVTEDRSAAIFRRVLARTWARDLIVAQERSGRLVGYAIVAPQRQRAVAYAGEIQELYLDPDRLGRGIGRALLNSAIWTLLDRGLDPVIVWVLANNSARHFYGACGGQLVARGPVEIDGFVTTRLGYAWPEALPLPLTPAR